MHATVTMSSTEIVHKTNLSCYRPISFTMAKHSCLMTRRCPVYQVLDVVGSSPGIFTVLDLLLIKFNYICDMDYAVPSFCVSFVENPARALVMIRK